jgi:hypothetical protein
VKRALHAGKFASVGDLERAYTNLERAHQKDSERLAKALKENAKARKAVEAAVDLIHALQKRVRQLEERQFILCELVKEHRE